MILCSSREERGKRCNKEHHTSKHMSQSAYCQATSDQQRTPDDQVISPRAGIHVCKSQHTFLWANGEMWSLSRLSGGHGRWGCRLCTSWKYASAVCHQRRNVVNTCNIESENSRCNERALQKSPPSKLSIQPSGHDNVDSQQHQT